MSESGSKSSSKLLAIDPGLDALGWAVFRRPLGPVVPTLPAARSLFKASGTVTTSAGTPDSKRLHHIGSQVEGLLHHFLPEVVVVEVPAVDGTYRRNRSGARSQDGFMPGTMKHVHRVIGVVVYLAEDAGATVLLLPAAGKKAATNLALKAAWPDLGRTNQDQRDAIILGYRALGKWRTEAASW